MKKFLSLLLLSTLLCPPAYAADKLAVVVSFSVLGDMVATIGGEDVNVKTLVGPDGDAHTYQPTPDDVKALAHAQVIFMNGFGLEGWMTRLLQSSGTKAHIIIATKGITPRSMDEDGNKITDPHAWQDLNNGHVYVKNILAALTAALPAKADAFKARAAVFDAAITAMGKSVRSQIAAVPASKRKVITSHDAFGYFGAAYGVTFLAPEGLSTEAEPSATAVARLIDQIKAEKVKRVFIENMSNPRLIHQIAHDSGAKMGGTLYSDALSPPGGAAAHYLDMFHNNLPKLVDAMQLNGN